MTSTIDLSLFLMNIAPSAMVSNGRRSRGRCHTPSFQASNNDGGRWSSQHSPQKRSCLVYNCQYRNITFAVLAPSGRFKGTNYACETNEQASSLRCMKTTGENRDSRFLVIYAQQGKSNGPWQKLSCYILSVKYSRTCHTCDYHTFSLKTTNYAHRYHAISNSLILYSTLFDLSVAR